jgi:hypothetical protein
VEEYYLMVGTTGAGSANVFDGSTGTTQNQLVSGIPIDGSNVYVRLSSKINGQWCYNDYVYTGFSYALAEMTSPTPGSTLPGAGVTFQWTAGLNVDEYCLEVGTTAGANDLYFGYTTDTSQLVTGIPRNNCPVYVRLWSKIPGHPTQWLYNDYTYTALNLCGLQWIQVYYGGKRHFWCGCSSDSLFVAAGVPVDTPADVPTEEWNSNLLWKSPDGINWTRVHLPYSSYPRSTIWGVTWGSDKFVAVGQGSSGSFIMTSPDANTWTQRSCPASGTLYSVAYGNGVYIVGTGGTSVLRSTNGISWSSVGSFSGGASRRVGFGNGRFVLATTGSYIYTSDNGGLNWTLRQNLGSYDYRLKCIAYGDNGFVIGGRDDVSDPNNTTSVWHSTDANSWTQVYDTYPEAGRYIIAATYTDCNRYVAVGGEGLTLTSDDGVNWTERLAGDPYTPPRTLWGVSYKDGKVVGVGDNTGIFYSICDCNCD